MAAGAAGLGAAVIARGPGWLGPGLAAFSAAMGLNVCMLGPGWRCDLSLSLTPSSPNVSLSLPFLQ